MTTGLLYSQIGYDLGDPMRAIVRGPAQQLGGNASFRVLTADGGQVALDGPVTYWGELWGSHWWVADFSALRHGGRYVLSVRDEGVEWMRSDPFLVGRGVLWATWFLVGVDQLERRARLAMNKLGWQDCGANWSEANSHASMIVGLTDLLEHARGRAEAGELARLEAQVAWGCDYLAFLQDHAAKRGHPPGAMSHQTPRFDDDILPADVNKAAVALARAARLLSGDGYADKKRDYVRRAELALGYAKSAKPLAKPVSHVVHGAPEGFVAPADDPMTRDLIVTTWAAVELARAGLARYQQDAVDHARRVMARQVPKDRAEGGLYGHFYTFASQPFTEKAWVHGINNNVVNGDLGGTFPNYVLPLLEMRRLWPDHPDAPRWGQAVRDFAYGYLLPACRANPFLIVPQGYYRDEGLIWFAGLWHGSNCVYPLTAALCLEFAREFGDRQFREVAVGNLQWIAGLNAGITAEGITPACHMWSADLPPGQAVPVSMINGIGRRTAGTWLNVRGAICNGFSTGDQFRYDVPATRANDGPHTFTDEDWITHAGGWVSALARL